MGVGTGAMGGATTTGAEAGAATGTATGESAATGPAFGAMVGGPIDMGAFAGAVTGALVGAVTGTLVGGLTGALVGGLTGALVGGLTGALVGGLVGQAKALILPGVPLSNPLLQLKKDVDGLQLETDCSCARALTFAKDAPGVNVKFFTSSLRVSFVLQ